MADWGSLSLGLAQGVQAGTNMALAREGIESNRQARKYRGLQMDRMEREYADQDEIKQAIALAANQAAGQEPEDISLAGLDAGWRKAAEKGRWDIASQFEAARTMALKGAVDKDIRRAMLSNNPQHIGRALSRLTGTQTNVMAGADGLLIKGEDGSEQLVPAQQVQQFLMAISSPEMAQKAALERSAKAYESDLRTREKLAEVEAKGKSDLTLEGYKQGGARELERIKIGGDVIKERTKAELGIHVVPGAEGEGSSLVTGTGRVLHGQAGVDRDYTETYRPEFTKLNEQIDSDVTKTFGEQQQDPETMMTVFRPTNASRNITSTASAIVLGSAKGPKSYDVDKALAIDVAKDYLATSDPGFRAQLEKSGHKWTEAKFYPDKLWEGENGRVYQSAAILRNGVWYRIGGVKPTDVTESYRKQSAGQKPKPKATPAPAKPVAETPQAVARPSSLADALPRVEVEPFDEANTRMRQGKIRYAR